MPDTVETPAPNLTDTPTAPELEASMSTFDRHMKAAGVPVEAPPVTPETTPAPAPAAAPEKPTIADEDYVPAQLLQPGAKPEAKPEDDFDKLISEKPQGQIKHEHFERVQTGAKKAVEQARAELAALKAELEKRGNGNSAELQKELDAIREAKSKLEEELERTALERHPKFREKYDAKEEGLRTQIERITKELGLDEDAIASAVSSSGKRRFSIMDDIEMSSTARSHLINLMADLDKTQSDKQAEIGKSRERLREWQQEQEASAKLREERERAEEDRIFNSALEQAKSKLPAFRYIDGDTKFNSGVDERIALAKRIFNGESNHQEVAELTLRGIAATVDEKIIKNQAAKITEMTDTIARLTAASPGTGQPPGIKPDGSNMSDIERGLSTYDRHMRAAGLEPR